MSQFFSPEDFTVGWISAVQCEYVAARGLLDEEIKASFYFQNDSNVYTYGKIHGHKVVIASLSKGVYGVASATSVAKDMIRSFPKIRFGLMVGIAGGAPSNKHDIRLGDIVVSTPSGQNGGVVHYSRGKEHEHQFERTGSLDQPPELLLSALSKLSGDYQFSGLDSIQSSLDKITSNKRIRKAFSRPPAESDNLFLPDFTHEVKDEPCANQCVSHRDQIQHRELRDPEGDDYNFIEIHYGTIGSADRLMKTARERDTLAAKEGLLCFETESAGLMNKFPCLVIRGICDYSDSHKNDIWQGYAAAVAAAFAKDLLGVIAAQAVEHSKPATQIMNQDNSTKHYNDNRVTFHNYGRVGNQAADQTFHGAVTFNFDD